MHTILAIACGGALGAVMRHLMNNAVVVWLGSSFPYGILFVNVLGCFVMGVFVSLFAHFWEPSQPLKAFLTVGLLGAFTTFSAFSLDTVLLFERGELFQGALYVLMSVVFAITGLVLGMFLVRVFV